MDQDKPKRKSSAKEWIIIGLVLGVISGDR